MINYDTIVKVDREIQEKVDLYRPFLEKREFGTFFEDVCFVSDDPADGIPSAGLNSIRNFLFLYGVLDQDGYKKHYEEIEVLRNENPNMNYYMLFCQDKYCACAPSVPAKGNVKKTFSIGILEVDELDAGEENDLLREDIRALKLISMAMAIYICNKGISSLSFDNYYVTASVDLNIQNVYFAIMHKLSEYADEINKKKCQIESNETEIEELKKREPKICEGNFPEDNFEEFTETLGRFSDYKDMESLRCKMEFEHSKADKAIRESISQKVDIARKAEAAAEKASLLTCQRDEITYEMHISEEAEDFMGYMTARNAGSDPVPTPDDILQTVGIDSSFDAQKIRALMPFAKELDKAGNGSGGKSFLSALLISMLFALCVGSVYITRFLKYGLNGATDMDFIRVIVVPIILLISAGIITALAYVIIKHTRKNIFKDIYYRLTEFFKKMSELCVEIRKYINKYLTVYYNYHVKQAKISELEEKNAFLDKEIKKIREQASRLNHIAVTVCKLGGETFETPDISFAKDRSQYKSNAIAFEARIKQDGQTEAHQSNNSAKTPCLWLKKVVFETGNINGGVQ